MKKQVLMLSVLFWALILLAPFPGNTGFRLAPYFDSDVALHGYGPGVEQAIPAAAIAVLPAEADLIPAETGTLLTHSIHQDQDIGPDTKSVSTAGDSYGLSHQSCAQQEIHPFVQDYFVQHELISYGSSLDGAATTIRHNREPLLMASSGYNSGSGGRSPRGLPGLFEYEEGKLVEPGEMPTHQLVPPDPNLRSPDSNNPARLSGPGSVQPGSYYDDSRFRNSHR